jgi:hypothetical protein
MVEKELNPQQIKTYEDMESWYTSHKDQYNCAKIAAAISTSQEEERIIALSVLFLNVEKKDNEFLSYSGIKLLKIFKSVEEGWKYIDKMCKEGSVEFEGDIMDVEGVFKHSEQRYLYYNSSMVPHITKWPGKGYNYEIKISGHGPSGPLVKVGSPFYRYDDEVIEEWVGKNRDSGRTLFQHQVSFIFPDYSARIDTLKLQGENITISIELGSIKYEDILLKYYFSDEEKIKQDEIIPSKSETVISLNFIPTIIFVYILNKKTEERIDSREIDLRYDRDYDIQIIQDSETTEYLLEMGEGPHLEYKFQFDNKSEFHETIAAFANTKGGRILVGVDDKGSVEGIKEKPEDLISRIQDSIRDTIEPTLPEIYLEPVEVRGKTIIVIEIPEGDDKPYMLTQSGIIYIRTGASDKRGGRSDLDRIRPKATRSSPY